MGRWVAVVLGGLVLLVVVFLGGAYLRLYGDLEGAGEPAPQRVPEAAVRERAREQQRAAARLTAAPVKQILFGDLHVHTTYSTDAFLWSLPFMHGGGGAHPVADACDYARYCSALDFWSINDHAEASTPRKWRLTKDAVRQCNAVAGDPANPDVVAYLGWEWTQVGPTPEEHYGHKNVVLRELADDEVPTRPIGAGGIATAGLRGSVGGAPWYLPLLDFERRDRYFDFIQFMEEVRDVPFCAEGVPSPDLPDDCYELADTPADLFRKLGEWGHPAMVIPHGNTWGFYTPPGATWDKQLVGAMHDPSRQFLIEIMSGHGNSEEYRHFRATRSDEEGRPYCPAPTDAYLPSCWRAGDLIEARCLEDGEPAEECARRAEEARQLYVEAGITGQHVVRGEPFEDWLDAGQCRDCFRPSFNYRPGGSTQYALALSNFDDPEEPRRFRFGIMASSDNHRARPGTGYKPVDRKWTTEANGPEDDTWRARLFADVVEDPLSVPVPVDTTDFSRGFATLEAERQASFFMTGGLVAVHADGRDRGAIWQALERKEVYGTSGPRILLWFHLLNAERPDGSYGAVPMGAEVTLREAPRFEVRAVGSLEQLPGCPDVSVDGLGADRVEALCRGECYHPSDVRRPIARIEVVRIRPQASPDEDVADLIEDPWRVFPCEPSPAGCVVQLEDPDFLADARDAVYYARAVETPSPVINADLLRCEYDEEGRCVKVNPCYGDYRTPIDDACAAPSEERAWSSPIFVDAAEGAGEPPAGEPGDEADDLPVSARAR